MQTIVTCPKCAGEMIPVRRSGVIIDRCADCHGVFLDRGELDKLITMEQRVESDEEANWEDDYEDEPGRDRRPKSRKRRFFEELFDID